MTRAAWCLAVFASHLQAPAQEAAWTNLNVPVPLEVTALESDAGGLYAGTLKGKVFFSRDGGSSWRTAELHGRLHPPSPIRALLSLGTHIVAAAGDYHGLPPDAPPTEEGGLFVSWDQGATWNPASLDSTLADATPILGATSLARAAGHVFAGSARGIYYSPESGRPVWRRYDDRTLPHNDPRFGTLSIKAMAGMGGFLFALTDSALYRRELNLPDSIRPWETLRTGVRSLAVFGPCLVIATPRGLQRTRDAGKTWEDLATGGFTRLFAAAPWIFAAKDGALLRSTDSGISFTTVLGANATSLVSGDGQLFVGLEGRAGAFRLLEGRLDPVPAGIFLIPADLSLALHGNGLWAGSAAGGIWMGKTSGGPWKHYATRGAVRALASFKDGVMYSDSGLRFRERSGTFSTDFPDSLPGKDHLLARGGGWVAAAAGTKVYVCRETEMPCAPRSPPIPSGGADIRRLAAEGDRLFAAANRLWGSRDAGVTWDDYGAWREDWLGFADGKLVRVAYNIWPKHYSWLDVAMLDLTQSTWANRGRLDDQGSEVRAIRGWNGALFIATSAGVFVQRGAGAPWAAFGRDWPPGGASDLALEGDVLVAARLDGRLFALDLRSVGVTRQRTVRHEAGNLPTLRRPGQSTFHQGIWRRLDGRARR